MTHPTIATTLSLALAAGLALGSAGCKDDRATTAPAPAAKPTAGGHSPDDGPGHGSATVPADGTTGAEHHADAKPLGEKTQGGLTFSAVQDEPVKAGGEGAFDLKVTGYPAGGKPTAVRFWVGTEAGAESVKAKAAEVSADNWHTHLEVPSPMPAGAKFWAEVEAPAGKQTVGFDLKG
ncbi:MAG: hypothetical protein JWO31_54 [Phycisphaerales bacterium]|nr:hypothetical protein [Phycisphaerales bacterium]